MTVMPVIPGSEALLGDGQGPGKASLGARSVARSRRLVPAVIGPVALLVLWEILALTVFAGKHSVPTPVGTVRQMFSDGDLYRENAPTTLREAGLGYLWGNLLALVLAALVALVPVLEKTLLRVAITSYCLPVVAIAPVLNIVLNGDAPKATLAALSVFFTTLVGALLGLRSADRGSMEVVKAYGGGRWKRFTKVQIRYALPATFAGLRIAAPAALLGAIIGEYLGGDSGLGIAMINSEQALEVNRTWGIALLVTIMALIGYVITELVSRWVSPWAPRSATVAGRSLRR
jgi:ABC-type nitrate/sulfonate/bicarbonate transport system permease component